MPAISNWNHSINFDVADFETPSSIDEVQKIVKKAYNENKRVTVLGAIHSTTQCMVGSDVAIAMTNSMYDALLRGRCYVCSMLIQFSQK
jgi:hypothetical protein